MLYHTKGYWQMVLTPKACQNTLFITVSGPLASIVPSATTQTLMDILLGPHCQYAAAYLDDVVITYTI